jgi:uncharacterized repeat protein (TIGR01451 family)
LRPVVLDPDAIDPNAAAPSGGAVLGPDVPDPRDAEYEYVVTNSGNVPVVGDPALAGSSEDPLTVTDDLCSPVTPVATPNPGDTNSDGMLDPGEGWLFQCSTQLDGPTDPDDVATLVNTASAEGVSILGPPDAPSDTFPLETPVVTASVDVIEPAIALQKTPCVDDGSGSLICDPDPDDADHLLVRPNTIVTYVYEVSNTGDVDLQLLDGLDDVCSGFTYIGGDADGNGLVNGGPDRETWEYRCTAEVGGLDDSPVINNVGVAASGPLGNVYATTDQATVRIFDPAIDVVKTVSDDFVPVGTDVTYTFEVTNTGEYAVALGSPADVELDPVLLIDVSRPANPACNSPTYVSGDVAPVGVLTVDPPETWVYTCTGTIDETTVDIAAVRGTDIRDGFVYDADAASVTPYEAGIDIVKSATPTQLDEPGGPVLYTYEVTNTGNVPLANVASQISDDTCSPVTYVSGDDDGNDLLTSADDLFETGPAEVWVFECFAEVTEDTINTVVVEGTPVNPGGPDGPEPLGPNVTDQDTATVVVVPTTTTTSVAPFPPTPTTTNVIPLPPTGGGSGSRSAIPIAVALLLSGLGLVALTRRRSVGTDC